MTIRLRENCVYRLRNGARVKVERKLTAPKAATIIATGEKQDVVWFQGQLLGRVGEKISWWPDGSYGATYRGHELDIVGRVKEEEDANANSRPAGGSKPSNRVGNRSGEDSPVSDGRHSGIPTHRRVHD